MTLVAQLLAHADHHQIYFGPPGWEAKLFDGEIGPLVVQPDPDEPVALIVRTGCWGGPVRVVVEHIPMGYEPEPLTEPVEGYEITEEITYGVIGPGLALIDDIGNGDEQVIFTPLELNGYHRLRVSARGRGTSYDGAVTEPEEDYLLQFWQVYDGTQPRITVGEDEASRLG